MVHGFTLQFIYIYLYLITSFIIVMPILNQELFSCGMNNSVMSGQRQNPGPGPFFLPNDEF